MRHFDVDFRDKNGERYQLSKRIAELTEALMANYFVYDTEVLEGVWFRDGKFTYEQREEGTWLPFDTEHDTWGYADETFLYGSHPVCRAARLLPNSSPGGEEVGLGISTSVALCQWGGASGL